MALLALPAFALAETPATLASPSEAAPASCQDQDFAHKAEALIAQRVNTERARLAPDAAALQTDAVLTRIAEIRACDMARGERPVSHFDGQGRFVAGDMVHEVFGPFGRVGENIVKMGDTMALGVRPFGPEEFASAAMEDWMKSPGHRVHILNPRYNISGIGVAKIGGLAVAVQVFSRRPSVSR